MLEVSQGFIVVDKEFIVDTDYLIGYKDFPLNSTVRPNDDFPSTFSRTGYGIVMVIKWRKILIQGING